MWRLTPREYAALRRVWRLRQDLTIDMYAGLQASMHNLWTHGQKRYTAEDFGGTKRKKHYSWQQDAAVLSAYANAMGGKDLTGLPREQKEVAVSEWFKQAQAFRAAQGESTPIRGLDG